MNVDDKKITASPFEFIAGSLSLCFVDTLGGRGGELNERLSCDRDFANWLQAAGLTIALDHGDLDQAKLLRTAIYEVCRAVVSGAEINAFDLETLNRFAVVPPLRPQVTNNGRTEYTAEDPFSAALSTIAEDAINLLSGEFRARIRICSGCQMVFVDKSRPGKRRWCSSAFGCGNKAKMAARRQRAKISRISNF